MPDMKNVVKQGLFIFRDLCIAAIAGFLLIVAVYALPTKPMRERLMGSISLLQEQWNYENLGGLTMTEEDYYSDFLMVDTAVNESTGNVIYDAMTARYIDWEDVEDDASEWLLREIGEDAETIFAGRQVIYGRYWHGYLVFLKPLLEIMNLQEVRVLNAFVQLGLLLFLFVCIYQELGKRYALAFIPALCLLNPFTIGMCFHFSDIYYITLIASIVILKFHHRFDGNHSWWKVFLWIGIATSFFDLLTYPLVGLGIPLLFTILLHKESSKDAILHNLIYSVYWVIGYAGMWVAKWTIGTLTTGINFFKDGLDTVAFRTAGEAGTLPTTYRYALQVNLQAAFSKPVRLVLFAFAIAIILYTLINRKKLSFNKNHILPLLMVMIYPFVWYFVIRNHSIIHIWFTYRVLSVSVLAFTFLLVDLLNFSKG